MAVLNPVSDEESWHDSENQCQRILLFFNGNTRSRCIQAFNGGLQVTFTDTQILSGTYGGATGRTIPVGESLLYGYYRVDACPQRPILIRYESISIHHNQHLMATLLAIIVFTLVHLVLDLK